MLGGTSAAMHDAGITISGVSCIQFITRQRSAPYGVQHSGYVPVANPVNLRVVFDEILPIQ